MASYTGALARASYYAGPLAPPGASPDHGRDVSGDDAFTPPHPDVDVPGTVWTGDPAMLPTGDGPSLPTTHTGTRAVPVPGGTPDARQWFTDRMTYAHSVVEYVSDATPQFTNAGTSVELVDYPDGGPWAAGITGPEWFMVGQLGYDVSNPPTEMNSVTGGRYRLGRRRTIMGEYDQRGEYGQDHELRAVQFRAPYLPQDTPPVADPVGRTKASSGTTTWTLPHFNIPQLFAAPDKEAITDATVLTADDQGLTESQFGAGSGEFL